jgi:hypothetical protein
VEARLIEVCKDLFPEFHPLKEVQGLAGCRNDLMLFQFNRQKILFEVFGTASQVSRDLRILDKTQADVKIAVIIDKEVDPKVFERFLRENPEENYPFIFVAEIANPERSHEGRLKLHELITRSEALRFVRFMRNMSATAFRRFLSECRRDAILVLTEDDLRESTITFDKVFITMTVRRLHELGIRLAALKKTAKWMSKPGAVEFALQKVGLGFNLFLYTDLRENFGFYSDRELLDFLHIGPEVRAASTLLSINSIVLEILDNYYEKPDFIVPRGLQVFAGRSTVFENPDGRLVTFSLPLQTSKIVVFPPMQIKGMKGLTAEEIIRAIEISVPDGPVRCQPAASVNGAGSVESHDRASETSAQRPNDNATLTGSDV